MRQWFRKYLCYCINVIKRNRLQCYDWHTLLGSWTFLIMLLSLLLLVTFVITLPPLYSSSPFFDWSFFIKSYHPDNFSQEPYGRYLDGLYHISLFHFVVLVYGVITPVFFALRFKFRKKYFVIIDLICLIFLFPTTFKYCVLGLNDNIDGNLWFLIIKIVVLMYTLSILYFRSLYYKHIEAVAAKDDEEKRQKTLRTNKTSL